MDFNKILKFFPFMPAEKNVGKLVLAILFYWVTCIVPLVGWIYAIIGIIFSVLSFMGKDLEQFLTQLFSK